MSEKLKILRQQYEKDPSSLSPQQRHKIQRINEFATEQSIQDRLNKAVIPNQRRGIQSEIPSNVRAWLKTQGPGVEAAFARYASKLSTAKNAFAQSLRKELGIDVDRGHTASLKGDPNIKRGLTPTKPVTIGGADTEGYAESGRANRRHGAKNLFKIQVLQQLNKPTNWMESAVDFVKNRPDKQSSSNTTRSQISDSLRMNKLGLGKINVDQAEMQSYLEHDLKKSGLFNRGNEKTQLKTLIKEAHNADLIESAKDQTTGKRPWDVTKKRRLTKQEVINQRGKPIPETKLIKLPRAEVPSKLKIQPTPTRNLKGEVLKVLPTAGLKKEFDREARINKVRNKLSLGAGGSDTYNRGLTKPSLADEAFKHLQLENYHKIVTPLGIMPRA